MLSDHQFHEYVLVHELSASAVQYIQEVRTSEPSRMIGVGATSNVVSFVPSEKMNFTISCESRAPERAFLLISESDEQVFEIWDQPQSVRIERSDKNGKKISNWYTGDFLILTVYGPVVVEVKSRNHLDVLMKRYPNDWISDDLTSFNYVPAEKAFSSLGLKFKVFVYSNEMRYFVNNLDLLQSCRRVSTIVSESKLDKLFDESFAWTLSDLKDAMGLISFTELISLIDRGKLFIDLHSHLLSEPKGCLVVRDPRLLEEAKTLFNRDKLTNPLDQGGIDFHLMPNEKYAKDALLKIEKINSGISSRSIRRWKNDVKEGEKVGLTPFQALIPKRYLSGNRQSKLPSKVFKFLQDHVFKNHVSARGLSIYRCYILYRVDAQDHHIEYPPVCWETYRQHIYRLPAGLIAGGRGGQRAANKDSEPTDPAERLLKSDLPWRLAAVDHYLADIYLIYFSDDGTVWVMRPWLTAMVDLCTGEVLAFAISFQSPSRKSVAKVVRECVRRHGKMPYEIIVDRGSDFKSVYFAALMAHLKCTYSLRPSAHPRYGSEVEGLFGEFKKQWLSQRKGNIADYKEARSFDGKFDPKKSAVLTLFDFYNEFEAFCSWRGHKPKGIAVESALDRFNILSVEYPFIAKTVEFNDEFLLATAVDTSNYEIDFQRGIHIGPLFYWSPKLSLLRGRKTSTEVRIDPENPHLIYARINNVWEICLSSHANRFSSLDPVSQRVEMLKVVESKNSKSLVARSADEELVRKIRLMDLSSENNKTSSKIIELPLSDDQLAGDDIFSSILAAQIIPLETSDW